MCASCNLRAFLSLIYCNEKNEKRRENETKALAISLVEYFDSIN